jgi:hypothetical protein
MPAGMIWVGSAGGEFRVLEFGASRCADAAPVRRTAKAPAVSALTSFDVAVMIGPLGSDAVDCGNQALLARQLRRCAKLGGALLGYTFGSEPPHVLWPC